VRIISDKTARAWLRLRPPFFVALKHQWRMAMKRRDEPQPRGFVRCQHFEELRTLRRKQPALYISMSANVKAQLEFYCLMRRQLNNGEQSRAQKIKERGAFCQCCGENLFQALTLDHITPRSKGGTGEPDNIQVLCLSCNQMKGNNESCAHQQIVKELIWQHIEPEAMSA
jgi:5-methylcytosine-specific restriction endonuclease McrA